MSEVVNGEQPRDILQNIVDAIADVEAQTGRKVRGISMDEELLARLRDAEPEES
jgi:hypothetical protein